MAYQTGVSSSINDLLNAVFSFAQGFGFTTGPTEVRTTNAIEGYSSSWLTFDIYSLQRNGIYFLFAVPRAISASQTGNLADNAYIYLNTASSWDGATFSGTNVRWARCDRFEGPHVGYHLFCDGLTVCVAVELVTNVYNHFLFGDITKNGDYEGGQIATGQSWRTWSSSSPPWQYTAGTFSPLFGQITGITSNSTSQSANDPGHVRTSFGGNGFGQFPGPNPSAGAVSARCLAATNEVGQQLLGASPNSFNGRSVLIPTHILHATSGSSGPWLQLGHIANMALVNIRDLQPKEMVNGDWMVFPVCVKNGDGMVYPNTGPYGYAFRK